MSTAVIHFFGALGTALVPALAIALVLKLFIGISR